MADNPVPTDNEFYSLLGLPREASEADVKRAYRQLAAIFHPDKTTDPSLAEAASNTFTRVQEAYAVLSDPATRTIYDSYGKEALRSGAGMEIIRRTTSVEDLRRQWARHESRQRERDVEARLNHRGTYVVEMDGSDIASCVANGAVPTAPDLTRISVSNAFTFVPSAKDLISIGAQAHVKRGAGLSGVLGTYRRTLSESDSLEINGMMGMGRSFASMTVSRQLAPTTGVSATLSASEAGTGLVIASNRDFGKGLSADFNFIVGPSPGLSFACSKTLFDRVVATGKLDLGDSASLTGSLSCKLGPRATLKAQVKVGMAGATAEVGGIARFTDLSSGGMFVGLSAPGVIVRLFFSRAGHRFSVPMVIHPNKDVKVFASAVLLPPTCLLALNHFVLRPLQRRHRQQKLARLVAEGAKEVEAARASTMAQARILEGASLRKLKRELGSAAGLVVLQAEYGVLQERNVSDRLGQERSVWSFFRTRVRPEEEEDFGDEADSDGEGGGRGSGSGQAGTETASKARPSSGSPAAVLPPTVVDVTTAVRFMVEDGTLRVPAAQKSGLIGFADPCPGAPKQLRVVFILRGVACEAVVGDEEALEASLERHAVADPTRAREIKQRAERLAEAVAQ